MNYEEAYTLTQKFKKLLEPACARIMTVGSVRRGDINVQKKGVHDIEFLIIPKLDLESDMFGHPIPNQDKNQLELLLDDLKAQGILAIPERKADGQKFKKFAIPGCEYLDKDNKLKEFCLELWIVNEKTWGIQAVIRTGPSEFSYKFVNSEKYVGFHKASGKRLRGALPHYYEYIAGETRIIVRSTRNPEHPELEQEIDLPTEEAAIALLGLNSGWIDPSERYLYTKEEK